MKWFCVVSVVLLFPGCLLTLPGGACGGGGGASGGGSTGGGGGGAATGGGTACPGTGGGPCSGFAVTTSGVLDLDFKRITVSGRVTLNGASLPTAARSRGGVVFSKDGQQAARLSLGSSGDSTYSVALTPGEYTVSYQPDDAVTVFSESNLCAGDTVQAMPCNAAIVVQQRLTASGVLDLDLRSVRVNGQVTLNGTVPPMASSDRGALSLRLQRGGSARTKAFGSSGAVSWSLHLISGTYDVDYRGDLTCPLAWPMPCNSGLVRPDQSLTTSGVLDLDLPAVRLTGRVTQDGATLPEGSARGALEFTRTGDPAGSLTLPLTNGATYDVWLLKGQYVISWRATPAACTGSSAPPIACTGTTLRGCE